MNFDNITSTLTTFTRKSLYEEIKGHQKDVEDLRKKKKRRRCKCNISSYIYD